MSYLRDTFWAEYLPKISEIVCVEVVGNAGNAAPNGAE